jgi:hypothetical protein
LGYLSVKGQVLFGHIAFRGTVGGFDRRKDKPVGRGQLTQRLGGKQSLHRDLLWLAIDSVSRMLTDGFWGGVRFERFFHLPKKLETGNGLTHWRVNSHARYAGGR